MTIEELLVAAENETREFKKAENGFEFDELVKYLCAFSNRGGGEVVIQRLLRELREEGRARLTGKTKSARWFLP